MEEGYERTKLRADSLMEEHERKMAREKQRHDNIMEEIKMMGKYKITILDRRER